MLSRGICKEFAPILHRLHISGIADVKKPD